MRLLISLKAASGVLAENPYRRIVLVGSISRLWVCNYNMQYVLQLACLEWPQPCWFLVFVWNEIVSDNCLATGDPTPWRNTTRDGSILHNLSYIRIWVWVRRFSFCHPSRRWNLKENKQTTTTTTAKRILSCILSLHFLFISFSFLPAFPPCIHFCLSGSLISFYRESNPIPTKTY